MAAGGRGAFGAAPRVLAARTDGIASALPAAGAGLRPGPVRTGRASGPRGGAGAPGRARPDGRRTLRAVPGGTRAGRRGRTVLPAAAPARRGLRRGLPGGRSGLRVGASGATGMTQIEMSCGTIDYTDTGGDGP